MNNKLILIDGSSLLSTSFYGNVPNTYLRAKTDEEREIALEKVLKTEDGQYTNGVFTMMKLFEKLFKQQNPSHVVVAWDLTRDTFRRELYPEYKAQRGSTPVELKSQFALAQEVLKAMRIPQFIFNRYEADDIIGTLAKRFKEEVPVYIWTKDQDAVQLVDEQTRLWLITKKAKDMYEELQIDTKNILVPDNAFEYTPHYVKHYYGIDPHQMIDLKGICGDTSDNIPGVKGVGEKSVVPLLCEFGDIDSIYDYIESTELNEIKVFLKELGIARSPYTYLMKQSETELVGKASALLSKQLATIHCDIEELQEIGLDSLKLSINEDGRKTMYEKLAFNSLLNSK